MFVTELDSFVYKFHQLWSAGHSAHLDLDTHAGRAWVGLRVQLGHHAPRPPHHLPNNFPHKKESPSRQRRRERRAAAHQANAEKASNKEVAGEVAYIETAAEAIVDVDESVSAKETSVEEAEDDQNERTIVDVAEEATKPMRILDELCPDEDYETAPTHEPKSICSVEFYPTKYKLDRLDSFRSRIEEYFASRKDVISRVIKCEVVNFGNNVRLVTEVKVKRGWIFFFCDPETNYGDLEGVRTVMHSCQDLSNCGG